jgi:hypothetical protein
MLALMALVILRSFVRSIIFRSTRSNGASKNGARLWMTTANPLHKTSIPGEKMKYRKTGLMAMLTAALLGVAVPSAGADPGTTSYSDWSWSINGKAAGCCEANIRGTALHYEGNGYSGISAQVKGTDAGSEAQEAFLQRNLSWVDDGWVTVASDTNYTWVRDDKRYAMKCGYSITYRTRDSMRVPAGEQRYAQTAPIYAARGASGERC